MAKTVRLDSDQRAFFALVNEAAFANPFSEVRMRVNRRIAGVAEGQGMSDEALLERVREGVRERLRDWIAVFEGGDAFRLAEADRKLLRIPLLFLVYHEHMDDFDRLIATQEQANEAVPVPFARSLLQRLTKLGFDEKDSAHFLAVFWQLRRAFHYIGRQIAGSCPTVIHLRMHLWNAVFTCRPDWYLDYLCGRMEDFSTLLLGETGTGKSAAARAIGLSGFIPFEAGRGRFAESFGGTFLPINLAQYSAGLIESELFGHRKGAFTGAVDHHKGVLEMCGRYGTVFVDEIGDVDLPTQTKLLTVLQDRSFSPVGSHQRMRFHGRVIAATNRNLDELRKSGHFRDDFYYRLCSDVIEVPSLRQRLQEDPKELEIMVEALVSRIVGPGAEPFAKAIEQRLPRGHIWPGNVRELEQAVRRICLTGHYLPAAAPAGERSLFAERVDRGELNADDLLAGYCRSLYARHGTYLEVARITGLDRRTVRKYVG
jgi:hypothetical protein